MAYSIFHHLFTALKSIRCVINKIKTYNNYITVVLFCKSMRHFLRSGTCWLRSKRAYQWGVPICTMNLWIMLPFTIFILAMYLFFYFESCYGQPLTACVCYLKGFIITKNKLFMLGRILPLHFNIYVSMKNRKMKRAIRWRACVADDVVNYILLIQW